MTEKGVTVVRSWLEPKQPWACPHAGYFRTDTTGAPKLPTSRALASKESAHGISDTPTGSPDAAMSARASALIRARRATATPNPRPVPVVAGEPTLRWDFSV